MILAQTGQPEQVSQGLLRIFDYLLSLEFPPRAAFVEGLQSLHTLQAVALVILGAVYLGYGFRWFKVLVVADGAALGALCGAYLGTLWTSPNMPLLLGVAGAILLGGIALPMVKYAAGLISAIAGGIAGYALWHFVATASGSDVLIQSAWAGGIIGIITLGMLTFVAFRPAVMVFTAVQGSLMVFSGICSLLLSHADVRESIKPDLLANDYLLTLLVGVPALLGFALQFATETAKIRKKRKTTEKPPV